MNDFIGMMEEMRSRTEYDYTAEMAKDVQGWVREKMPLLTAAVEQGNTPVGDAYEKVFHRLAYGDEWRQLGQRKYGKRQPPAQWQCKDMVRRAGAEQIEMACENNGIDRRTILTAIMQGDWKSIDDLIRYDHLSQAVMMALDNIKTDSRRKSVKRRLINTISMADYE